MEDVPSGSPDWHWCKQTALPSWLQLNFTGFLSYPCSDYLSQRCLSSIFCFLKIKQKMVQARNLASLSAQLRKLKGWNRSEMWSFKFILEHKTCMLYSTFMFLWGQNQKENPDWSGCSGKETGWVLLCQRKYWTVIVRTVETWLEKGQRPSDACSSVEI